MRIRLLSIALFGTLAALLLHPGAARAADCDFIATRTDGTFTIKTRYLLDSDTAAAEGTACDMADAGAPEYVRVSVQAATGASSGYSVAIRGSDGASTLDHDLAVLRQGAVPAALQATIHAPLPRYLQAQSYGVGTPTDFDVIAEYWIRNDPGNAPVSSLEDHVILCGQLDENGTIFFGPATAAFGGDGSDASISSTACDALDNATEATVDAPILTDAAFGIVGARCAQSGTLEAGETVTYTLRSAEADTSPEQTCTISEGETDCTITTPTDTDVAAGATLAVEAVMSSDNSDDDGWCEATIAIR